MIICEGCNTENLDAAQYCDECGASLSSAAFSKASAQREELRRTGDGKFDKQTPAAAANSETAAKFAAPAMTASSSSIGLTNGTHAKLVIERGRSAGKQFLLTDEEAQIGRWDADGGIFPDVDLDADDPEAKVSRRHARIMRRNGQYFIEDLGSTNGTFINRGRRLLPGDRHPLRDGDEIIVGKTFLRFHIIA